MATEPLAGARIVALAREWIGTPYIHQASLKGVGCDCLGLLRGVWRECNGLSDDPQNILPYSADWAEARGKETLYLGLLPYLTEIPMATAGTGAVLLFRMNGAGPAKHCGILAVTDGCKTLIHARMNKRVSEEPFGAYWQSRLAFTFVVP